MASDPTRMSVRVDRLSRKCETLKISYATRAEALDGCEQAMEADRVHPGCHLMPYECDACGEWHIRNHRIVFLAPADLSKHDYRKGEHD